MHDRCEVYTEVLYDRVMDAHLQQNATNVLTKNNKTY